MSLASCAILSRTCSATDEPRTAFASVRSRPKTAVVAAPDGEGGSAMVSARSLWGWVHSARMSGEGNAFRARAAVVMTRQEWSHLWDVVTPLRGAAVLSCEKKVRDNTKSEI